MPIDDAPLAGFLVAPQPWSTEAACKDEPIDLFFDPKTEAAALRICNACQVRSECAEQCMIEEGKAPYGRYGVRGATSPEQREVIHRRGGLLGRDPAALVAGRDGQRRVSATPRQGMPWSRHHATLLRKLSIVLDERLTRGDRLPDVAKLASILGCNPTPLKHVLTEAWAVGIIDKAQRGFVYRGDSQPTRRQRSPHA